MIALERYTNELRERALELGGIVDADVTLKLDRSELRARVDRERAADLGVRTEDIATALRLMVGGDERVSRYRDATTNENEDFLPESADSTIVNNLLDEEFGGRDLPVIVVYNRAGGLTAADRNEISADTKRVPELVEALRREAEFIAREFEAPTSRALLRESQWRIAK